MDNNDKLPLGCSLLAVIFVMASVFLMFDNGCGTTNTYSREVLGKTRIGDTPHVVIAVSHGLRSVMATYEVDAVVDKGDCVQIEFLLGRWTGIIYREEAVDLLAPLDDPYGDKTCFVP